MNLSQDTNKLKEIIEQCNTLLSQGDINGTKINKTNLDRLNKANTMALSIFDFTDAEFSEPQQNKSYVMTTLYCGNDVDIENDVKFRKKSLFDQFVAIVDSFHISEYGKGKVCINYTVDGVWEE